MKPLARRVALFAMVLSVIGMSCGDGIPLEESSGNGDGDNPDGEYFDSTVPANTQEIQPNVWVEPGIHLRPGIDIVDIAPENESFVSVDADANEATFTGAAVDAVAEAERGDILVTPTYIARVGYKKEEGEDVILGLETFELLDVIHGEWSLEVPLDREGDQRYPIDPVDYETRKQMLGLSYAIDHNTSDGNADLNVHSEVGFDASPHMQFEGKIPFYSSKANYSCSDPQVEVNLACVMGRCAKRYRYCVEYLMMRIDFGVNAEGNVSVTSEESASLTHPEDKRQKTATLGQIPLTGPFFLRPSFYLDAQSYLKASLKGELGIGASSGVTVPLGFEYKNGRGMSMIPNSNYGPSTSSDLDVTARIEAALEAGAWFEPGLMLSICTPDLPADVCFHGLELGARVTVKAEYEDQVSLEGGMSGACLTAGAYLDAKVRGKVEFEADFTAVSFSKTVLEKEFSPLNYTIYEWDGAGKFCLSRLEQVARFNDIFNIDIDCEKEADNPYIGTCVDDFMSHCWDPEGECKGTVYEDDSYDMVWESNDRYYENTTSTQDLAGVPVPTEKKGAFISREDEMCADNVTTISYSGGAEGCRTTSVVTLKVTDEEMVAAGYEKGDQVEFCTVSTGVQRVTCPDSSGFSIAADQSKGSICMQGGPCKFEAGILDNMEDNRSFPEDVEFP